VQSTLKRESKGLEIANTEAVGFLFGRIALTSGSYSDARAASGNIPAALG